MRESSFLVVSRSRGIGMSYNVLYKCYLACYLAGNDSKRPFGYSFIRLEEILVIL